MDIQASDYIATATEIGVLAREYFTAQDTIGEGRNTYLRALVATAQARVKLTKAEVQAAVDSVHEEFYTAVLTAANESVAPRVPKRALMVNKRTNFARSSVSILRTWLKAGGDLMKLTPRKVTKASLRVERKARPPSPVRLKASVERRSKALVVSLLALGERSPAAAAEELELLMGQLTDQLGAITGGTATSRAVKKFQSAKTQILSKTEVARALAGGP